MRKCVISQSFGKFTWTLCIFIKTSLKYSQISQNCRDAVFRCCPYGLVVLVRLDGLKDVWTAGQTDMWTDWRTFGRNDGRVDGRTDGRTDERTYERTAGRTDDGRTNGLTDGRTDGWTDDGRTDEKMDGQARRVRLRTNERADDERSDGRKNVRTVGRNDKWKNGMIGGRREGCIYGLQDGRTDVWTDAWSIINRLLLALDERWTSK